MVYHLVIVKHGHSVGGGGRVAPQSACADWPPPGQESCTPYEATLSGLAARAQLAESTDGRNTGPTLDQAGGAPRVAARDPRLRALSIGELNPTCSAGDPEAIPRFAGVLAGVLAAAAS